MPALAFRSRHAQLVPEHLQCGLIVLAAGPFDCIAAVHAAGCLDFRDSAASPCRARCPAGGVLVALGNAGSGVAFDNAAPAAGDYRCSAAASSKNSS